MSMTAKLIVHRLESHVAQSC